MSPKKKAPPEMWKALSNKIRRDLLTFIGERGSVSFTDIQAQFKMKVGTLYHHLDTLGDLTTQDENKKYLLTSKGQKAYQLIDDELDAVAKERSSYGRFHFLHNVFLRPIFNFIDNDSLRSLGLILFVFTGLGVISFFASTTPFFLFPSFISPAFVAPLVFILSTLITYLFIEAFCMLFFRKNDNKLALFQGVMVSQIPLILFCVFEWLVTDFSYPHSPLDLDIWLFIVLIAVQLVYLGLLTESIIVIKELRMEKAGLVALFTIYLLSTISFLILRGLVVQI